MYIRAKSNPNKKWVYFDDKKSVEDLDCYEMYEKHSKFDARIIKITTSKEVIKES